MWGSEAEQLEFGRIYPLMYGDPAVRNRRRAVKALTALADRGYAPAQFAMAMAYFDGDGVRRDYTRAYQYAMAAAEQQYPEAENMVGGFHAMVVPKHNACAHDPALAVQWYLKAAGRGNVGAMLNLMNCYATGLGIGADQTEVYLWASLAVHCTTIRNRGAETIRDRTAAALDPGQRAAADDRIARLKSELPHSWSEGMFYWKALSER